MSHRPAFSDNELAQLDRALERRERDAEFAKRYRTVPVFADILAAHGMPQAPLELLPQPEETPCP